jgi:recombination protein RecR
MPRFPRPIEELIEQLGTLPGVGPKTAERYAFSLLKRHRIDRERLSKAISGVDGSLTACSTCRNYTEQDPCNVCDDPQRDRGLICVVATEQDLLAIERTGEYRGLYHILGGNLSPSEGITPEELTVRDLLARVRTDKPTEIILALDPTIEGESTTLYLTRMLEQHAIPLTRLARGLPVGSELGYADEVTLSGAFRDRREVMRTASGAAAETGTDR